MVSLTLVTVGFLLAMAGVMALARHSTARWERDKRASVAGRADETTRRTSAAGSALGRVTAQTRAGLAALRDQASRIPRVTVPARLLPTGTKHAIARGRPVRRLAGVLRSSRVGGILRRGPWAKSPSPALPVDGDGADTTLDANPSRAATVVRGNGVAKEGRRQLFRRTVPRGRRRGLPFLHRADKAHGASIPHEDRDESPAAR